jgi:hypothetical protein
MIYTNVSEVDFRIHKLYKWFTVGPYLFVYPLYWTSGSGFINSVSGLLLVYASFRLALISKALFRSHPKTKKFQDSLSHQILRHMHGALNVGKKNN